MTFHETCIFTNNEILQNQTIQNKAQPIKLSMINNASPGQGNIQLVMDPRMGVILGTVATQPGKVNFEVFDFFIYILMFY